jgi:thioesterase domain-containing protein
MISLTVQDNCDREKITSCGVILFLQHIHSRLAPGAPFSLLGYSFGGLLALELALELEAEGWEGHLYLVDSAPVFMKLLAQHMVDKDEKKFETSLICRMFSIIAPHEATAAAVSKVFPIRNVKSY